MKQILQGFKKKINKECDIIDKQNFENDQKINFRNLFFLMYYKNQNCTSYAKSIIECKKKKIVNYTKTVAINKRKVINNSIFKNFKDNINRAIEQKNHPIS